MYSCGPPHMANQKQDGQLEHTYSSYVMIRDVALKTCQRRWMIGRRGERGSGISVLAAWHDDDCYLTFTPRGHPRLFSWAVWHSCRMGARNQEQTRGRIGPQLRLGNLRVGELHFCPLCTALDQASSLSRKLAYVPGPTFGFVKLLASSGSHCTKWADEQHWQAGFESRLVPDLPLPFIPTLIGLRAFDLVSSRVWWEAATNIGHPLRWWEGIEFTY